MLVGNRQYESQSMDVSRLMILQPKPVNPKGAAAWMRVIRRMKPTLLDTVTVGRLCQKPERLRRKSQQPDGPSQQILMKRCLEHRH